MAGCTHMLLVAATAQALSTATTTAPAAKARLRTLFAPVADAVLCDPETKAPLEKTVKFVGGPVTTYACGETGTAYGERLGTFVDLVEPKRARTASELADELRSAVFRSNAERVQMDTFRNPFVSFLYERGWRDSFKRSGFPGIDEEFAEVCEWFAPAALASDDRPSVVLDLSCGTGLMARRLAGARAASTRLIAADYSESMLLETKRRFVEADVDLELYRVDVAKLPFQTASLDAVHAGAALHCWVELEAGLFEAEVADLGLEPLERALEVEEEKEQRRRERAERRVLGVPGDGGRIVRGGDALRIVGGIAARRLAHGDDVRGVGRLGERRSVGIRHDRARRICGRG